MVKGLYRVVLGLEVKADSTDNAMDKVTEAIENLVGTREGSYRMTAIVATEIFKGDKD